MKNYSAIPAIIASLLLLTGCSATLPQQQQTSQAPETKQEATQNPVPQQTPAATAKQQALLCEVSGLGDTSSAWNQEFGTPSSKGDTLKDFKNGEFTALFENDRALNITFNGGENGQKNPLIEKMLPKDGQKLSETIRKVGNGQMIVQKYHSALLEAAIPETKGNYTVMENYMGQTYSSTVADCNPNLSK